MDKSSAGSNETVIKTIMRQVVKEELASVEEWLDRKLDQKLARTQASLLEALDEKIANTFERYRHDILTKLDGFIKEIRDYRDEQSVHQAQHDRVNERLGDLENIHPQGQHSSM